eukprot:sb/3474043/
MDPASAKRRSGASVIDQGLFRVQLVQEKPAAQQIPARGTSLESTPERYQPRTSLESPVVSPRVVTPRVRARTCSSNLTNASGVNPLVISELIAETMVELVEDLTFMSFNIDDAIGRCDKLTDSAASILDSLGAEKDTTADKNC